jgi:hypothetical protein
MSVCVKSSPLNSVGTTRTLSSGYPRSSGLSSPVSTIPCFCRILGQFSRNNVSDMEHGKVEVGAEILQSGGTRGAGAQQRGAAP